jgi:hypothetical protein
MTALTLLLLSSFHQRLALPQGPVHLWAPSLERGQELTVLYVHGYFDTADSAVEAHGLLAQFERSAVEATFVVPEAPRDGADAVRFADLEALLSVAQAQLGRPLSRRVVVLGHSGGVRTIRAWLADARVDTVVLLDAVYGDPAPFERWVQADARRRLVLIAHSTLPRARALAARTGARTVADAGALPPQGAALWPTRTGHLEIITGGGFLAPVLRALAGPDPA